MSSTVRPPIMSFFFCGITKAAVLFGVNNQMYSRNRRTGKWRYSCDVGVWLPVTDSCLEYQAEDLEPLYRKWLKTCSKDEFKASKIRSRKP